MCCDDCDRGWGARPPRAEEVAGALGITAERFTADMAAVNYNATPGDDGRCASCGAHRPLVCAGLCRGCAQELDRTGDGT